MNTNSCIQINRLKHNLQLVMCLPAYVIKVSF